MGTKVFFSDVDDDIVSQNFVSNGGEAVVNVRGDDFATATVSIQMASANDLSLNNPSPGEPRFINLTNGELTDNATVKLDYLPSGILVRVVVTGSTSQTPPVNLFADILQ